MAIARVYLTELVLLSLTAWCYSQIIVTVSHSLQRGTIAPRGARRKRHAGGCVRWCVCTMRRAP
jgi:hypothetical protein